jgi:hypothetical protein
MSDMLDVMQYLRSTTADPVLRRVFELAAADIITHALESDDHLWDDAWHDMTAEERAAFIADSATGMGPALQHAAIWWNLFEATPPSEWLERRRSPGSSSA